MKSIVKILLVIFFTLMAWTIGAFAAMSWDIHTWHWALRLVVLVLLIQVVIAILNDD